jgi:hypothetical protein
MSRHRLSRRFAFALVALCLIGLPASAITVEINYNYGASFFPVGSQARAALDAAASYFSNILNDTFSAIQTPAPLVKPNGTNYSWHWEMQFINPSTSSSSVIINDPTVAADRYIVYAGARNLTAPTLGIGGPGGYYLSHGGSYHPNDAAQVAQITSDFEDAVENRGETSGFARWGGTISFDSSPQAPWHFNHTTPPSGNVTDFYSVAIHELAHALGFGEEADDRTTPWESQVSGEVFIGNNAIVQYGGAVPLNPETNGVPDLSHWENGTSSVVYGTSTAQEAAMVPDLFQGTRKLFTALDAAAIKDIGWTVIAPPPPANVLGDYNDNDIVDAADFVSWRKWLNQSVTLPNDETPGSVVQADYTVWRKNFGKVPGAGAGAAIATPEPAGALLFVIGGFLVAGARRKRRG